jgi:hypothetical protein
VRLAQILRNDENPFPGSIWQTTEERVQVARNSAHWTEDKHYRTPGYFRQGVAEVLTCLEQDADATIPWDDMQRVIQGWRIVRFRLRLRLIRI